MLVARPPASAGTAGNQGNGGVDAVLRGGLPVKKRNYTYQNMNSGRVKINLFELVDSD